MATELVLSVRVGDSMVTTERVAVVIACCCPTELVAVGAGVVACCLLG
jgi:hypothetical protein